MEIKVPLETNVRRHLLPDTVHFVEVLTKGMQVTCRVVEQRGSFEITREIFWIDKSKHRWYEYVAKFQELAAIKYNVPITERLNNSNKAGSI